MPHPPRRHARPPRAILVKRPSPAPPASFTLPLPLPLWPSIFVGPLRPRAPPRHDRRHRSPRSPTCLHSAQNMATRGDDGHGGWEGQPQPHGREYHAVRRAATVRRFEGWEGGLSRRTTMRRLGAVSQPPRRSRGALAVLVRPEAVPFYKCASGFSPSVGTALRLAVFFASRRWASGRFFISAAASPRQRHLSLSIVV